MLYENKGKIIHVHQISNAENNEPVLWTKEKKKIEPINKRMEKFGYNY